MKRVLDNAPLLLIITAVAWSGNAIVARGVSEIVPPIGLAFWRWVVALPIFLFLAWPHLRGQWPLALRHWKIMLFLSGLSIAGYNSFIYIGLGSTTALNAVLIHTARPIVILLLTLLILRERVKFVPAIGLLLGLAGGAIIILRGEIAVLGGVQLNPGDIWVIAASVGWAVYTVYLPKRPALHPTCFMAVTVMMGVALLLPFYVWEAVTQRAVPIAPETFWSIGYLALISSVVAFLGYNRVVELAGPNRAGLVSYLTLLFGTVLAMVFLGEIFHFYHGAGIAFILVGVAIATGRRNRTNQKPNGAAAKSI